LIDQPSPALATEQTVTTSEDFSDIDSLLARLSYAKEREEKLVSENQILCDQLLRRQAEFENLRRRFERDRKEIYARIKADLLIDLLPILDNFERALQSQSMPGTTDMAESLRLGIELIYKQFKDVLARLGLEQIEALGKPFDPHLHEALATEESETHEDQIIIEEMQRGYRLNNRLLRPARVKVAVRK